MGLFSFVTDAGGKLGGAVYDMLHDDEDWNKPTTVSPERQNELRKLNIEKALRAELGESASDVSVAVNGESVVLNGSIGDQEGFEKAVLIAGNQHGIGAVESDVAVEKSTEESTFYTVKSGDTLGKIAAELYQNAGKYTVIFEANKPMLTDPNKIYPGQVLRIPSLTA